MTNINLVEVETSKLETMWEVSYSGKIKKGSRLLSAVQAVIPCLNTQIQVTKHWQKIKQEKSQQKEKAKKRHFFMLRHKEKKPAIKPIVFKQGETLKPKQTNFVKAKDFKPNYEQWEVKSIFSQLRTPTIADAKAFSIIDDCKGVNVNIQDYATALYHLKHRCPKPTAKQLPSLLNEVLSSLEIDKLYLESLNLKGDLFDRVQVKDHCYYANSEHHFLCTH